MKSREILNAESLAYMDAANRIMELTESLTTMLELGMLDPRATLQSYGDLSGQILEEVRVRLPNID